MQVRPIPRITISGCIASAALLCASTTAMAQAPSSPTPAPSAAAAAVAPTVEEGDRLRDSGDLTAALRVYRSVQANQDSALCQRRIAETEDRLGQFGFAYLEYAKLLDRYASVLEPSQRGTIEARLRSLDEQTGMLALEPLNPGAVVRVDGRVIPTELLERPLRVARGERRITVEQTGYKPVTLNQTVGDAMARVTLPLEALPTVGTLNVSALSNAEATLFVDGQKVGQLPQRLQLAPGEHTLYAEGPTVYSEPKKLTVTVQEPTYLTLTLLTKAAVVDIDPGAPDSVIYVDDRPVGTGPRTINLTPGRHVLELRRPQYRIQKLVYEALAGQRKPVKAGPYVPLQATGPAIAPAALPKEGIPAALPAQSVPAPTPAAKSDAATQAKVLPEQKKESPFVGIFGDLIVPIMLKGDSTHGYNTNCPADIFSGACTTSAPKGGGLGLRLGYFYEWVGLEVIGAGAVDVTTAELKFPPIPTISQQMLDLAGRNVFVRAGGMIGGGLRVTTPIQGIRLTLGADYVYVARRIIVIPDSFAGASLSYSVPGFFLDGGIQLGSTPGARFYLAAFLLIENAHKLVLNRDLQSLGIDPTLVPPSLTTQTVYQGRQYFWGPMLGIAFGH